MKEMKLLPTITGNIIIAPSVRVFGTAIRVPPTISTKATKGKIHFIQRMHSVIDAKRHVFDDIEK